jgi:lipoprotein-releasing system ATP-binding protein
MNKLIMSATDLIKGYSQLTILKGISLDIFRGEALCIVGASGAGKSTLLHILGTLDKADGGEVRFEERNLSFLSDEELATFRSSKMGFVFQFHHLLSEFTAIENVMIPCRIAGETVASSREKAKTILDQVGLVDRLEHFPNQLSGGELQRVAIARALVRNPQILFADEPTGNLDSHNSGLIQELFFELKERTGLTLVAVTHDAQFASKFQRILRLLDGQWVKGL